MRPVFFIFLTVLIDSIGIGIIFPVSATIVSEVTGQPIENAATEGGMLMFTYALMQFIFAPVLGGLSDRYGRRPVLLLSLFGLGLDYLILFYAPTYTWLIIGRLIAGMCGGSFTTAFAYIADITPAEKRAQSFGIMGAAFGLGFIIGPFIGGLFSDISSRAPFMAAAVLSLLNFLYGLFILPESLVKENRRSFDIKRANPFGAFVHLNKMKSVRVLVLVMFMLYLAGQVMPVIWTFYTKYLFTWTDKQVGYSLAFVGLMVAIVQGGLIRIAQQKLGQIPSVLIGFILYFSGLMLFAFANQEWMMYAFTAVYALGGIGPPTIQSLISSQIPANEQGEIQGVLTSLTSLATILSPLLMSGLFTAFTGKDAIYEFPGVSFFASAIIILLAGLIFLSQIGRIKSSSPSK
ncbi:MAG: TCR/Tet family MFS transporter [Flavobacteriales bacterium]|nr:TCR/Tet family MFS transporter [Flavobacteriales bacterium]